MEWFVKAFIKASLTWLALAVSLGVAMAVQPAWLVYRTAHLHMALLGFVAMMIFGVAYHVIPRFTGNPLHSRRLAGIHWWLANAGLAILAIGFLVRPLWGTRAIPVLGAGGVLAAMGAYAFAYNLWRTLDAVRAPVGAGVPISRG
jgi:cytochrome c oxidase cbb3-type subunit 1